MRTEVKAALHEVVLTRILEVFGQELIDSSDEEVIEAARGLGMDPQMKGSVAFAGLTFPAKWQLAEFFDIEVIDRQIAREKAERYAGAIATDLKSKVGRLRRSENSKDTKDADQK